MTFTRRTFFLTASALFGTLATAAITPHSQALSTSVSSTTSTANTSLLTPSLSKQSFSSLLNRSFRVQTPDDQSTRLKLVAIHSDDSQPQLEQFNLEFRGSSSTDLKEGIYQFEHPELGTVSLLMIPSGGDRHNLLRADVSLLRT